LKTKIRVLGLCNQCDAILFPDYHKEHRGDFYGMEEKVSCINCGDIVADSNGNCRSDCSLHHHIPVQLTRLLTTWHWFKDLWE